jgi:hypothetical protein
MGRSKQAPGVSNRRRSSGKKSIAEDISVDDLLAQRVQRPNERTPPPPPSDPVNRSTAEAYLVGEKGLHVR